MRRARGRLVSVQLSRPAGAAKATLGWMGAQGTGCAVTPWARPLSRRGKFEKIAQRAAVTNRTQDDVNLDQALKSGSGLKN